MTHTLDQTQFSEPSLQTKSGGAGSIPLTHNSPREAIMHSSDLWTEEAGLLDVTCRNPDRWISRINCRLFYIFDYFSSRQFSSRAEFLREIFDHLPFGGGVTSARTRRLVAAGARNCLLIAVISACAGTKGVNPNDNPHQGRAQKCWICRAVLRVGLA